MEPAVVTGPVTSWSTNWAALYDVTHGAGLAAIWGSWARYVYDANPERFAQFAANIFDIPCSADFNKDRTCRHRSHGRFFRSIQMPTSLHELGLDLTEKQIHDLAFKCSFEDTRTIGVFKQLNMKDMEKIYTHGKINDTFMKQMLRQESSSSSAGSLFLFEFSLSKINFCIISTFASPSACVAT